MKKIDFHIHTISTISDSQFSFSLDVFKQYTSEVNLDAVAITNHDVFDKDQFTDIQNYLDITVFPGIEINLEKCHILVIADGSDLVDFQDRCDEVSKKVTNIGDYISVADLTSIFDDLNNYLVIPHYDKKPSISSETLKQIGSYVSAGEVDSPKKFLRAMKDDTVLTPVLFSDMRVKEGLSVFPQRSTYIDCGELSLEAIKLCLQDKNKVALSQSDGNKLWPALQDGQMLSTGLNVLLGDRSSGKTHTLNEINKSHESVKYIEQFSLVQKEQKSNEKEFKRDVQRRKSLFVDDYLLGFKGVLEEIIGIDLDKNDRELEDYLDSLLKSADQAYRRDLFSNTALFDEVKYSVKKNQTLLELIESVRQVIENEEYRTVINKHLDFTNLKNLIIELIELLWEKNLESQSKKMVNGLVKDIKDQLNMRTSATQVNDVDFYEYCMDIKRVERFEDISKVLQTESVISEEDVQGFKIEAKKSAYKGAMDIKRASGTTAGFSTAFAEYSKPYQYLQELLEISGVAESDLYKLFVDINYRILNKDGVEVSGGERSEFRLLQEIKDAQKHDILLIDEPESSFDNLFLKSDVNELIKKLSETMPVVIVTHNSTVGASIGADYLIYASKERKDGNLNYRLYSGYPTDKTLKSVDGKTLETHDILMNSLEAGKATYDKRKENYEAVRN